MPVYQKTGSLLYLSSSAVRAVVQNTSGGHFMSPFT
jgi:hypothetical protein